MAQSVAAVVHGFRSYNPDVVLGGVILNRVAGEGHATLCREALEPLGVSVLGVIRHDDELVWRERHLGLVPVAEQRHEVEEAVARIGAVVAAGCDLDAIVQVARAAPAHQVTALPEARPSGTVRLAVAGGLAFNFVYPENLALFEQAGAELLPFDPLHDEALPEGTEALYLAGGFPEVFAAELAGNEPLKREVAEAVRAGAPTWAECGGLLWLCRSLDGHRMVGAVDATATMTDRLTIGYRTVTTRVPSPLGPSGTELRGHEFHRSVTDPSGDALAWEGRFGSGVAGFATDTLFAGYLHQHLASTPAVVERFVATASSMARA